MKAFFQTIVNRVLAHRACVVNQNPLRIGQKTPPYPLRTILVPVKYVANRASCIVNRASLLLLLAMVSSVNVWGADVTYTFTSKSWGDVNSAWTSGKDGNGYTSGQGVQITAGVTGANATTKSSFTNVSKIVVNYCTNAKAGKGTIKVQVGSGTEKSYSVSAPSSGGTTLRNTDEFTFSPVETGKIKITVECGTNSIYINSITITTAASYTVNWTINPAAGGTLSATSGTSTTVTPNSAYTYGSPAYTVTSGTAAVSQSTNTFTATPSANCTIRINMVEKPKYTVTLKDDNSTLTQVSVGASVTLPSRTGCTGYAFAGWTKSWTSEQSSWTTTAPTIIPAGSYTPAGNENLYPVYTKTEGGGGTTTKTLYFEPFTGSANSSAVQSTNVAATTDMFTDASATVWSHYSFNAGTTTSYATNLDGDAMSNETKITKQINNSTVTMMEVTGINISNASNLSLSLYNRRSYTSATLSISYKIDNGDYTAVGGTMSYNSTNDRWKLCDGLTINGTGHSLSLKIQLVVSGSTNRTMTLDDIKITGTVSNSTTSYISVPSCGPATYTLNLSTSPTDIATVIAKVNGESVTEAEENATVTLSYSNVTSGYVFDHWYVLNESTLEDETLPDNTFTMPASEVSVEGYFKAIPSISVNVTDVSMTVGETDKTLSITASASDGGTLTYTWYQVDSKTTSGGTQVGTGSSYSIPSNLAAGTYYYYCKVSNGAASITSNCATVTVNSASGYSMHLQNTQDGDKQYFTYGGTGSYSYIDNFVIPDESYCTQFFVGNNGYWYGDNLGNANAKSANWYYGWLPFTNLQDVSCGTITLGNATGVIGRLRIDDNSSEDNLHISFDPNGYGFVYGIENNEGWQNIAFARNGETNVWKTASLTLTSEMVAKSYYVGLLKENGGYAHSYRSEGNSKGASLTTTIFGIGVKSGAGNNFDGTISSNTTGVGANTQGCFEIWTDNCNQNFYCHFVPDYNYILKDEDDNVLYASAFVSCEAANKSTTIDNSHNPTKTGYQLMGWSRTKGASNVDVALGGAYNYWKSNDALYPVWRAIVYTLDNITVKNNPTKLTYNQGETLEATGLTLTAHYTDDISGPGKDEVVTSGFTCSPTTLSTPGASIPITVTYQGKQTIFNVKVKAVYNVTFINNGDQYGDVVHVVEGGTLGTLPTLTETASCDPHSKTFVGWMIGTIDGKQQSAPTMVSASTPVTDNMTLNAVWAMKEGSENQYKRVKQLSELVAGTKIVIIDDHNSKIFKNDLSSADAPIESNNLITITPSTDIWTLGGNSTDGWTLSNSSGKLGIATLPTSSSSNKSKPISITNTNSTWTIGASTITNCFYIRSKGHDAGLELSNGSWIAYYNNDESNMASSTWFSERLYIPSLSYSNYLTTCSSDPLIEVSPAELSGFSTVATTGNPSAAQSFTVEGYNLTEDITISVSNGYEICQTENGTYSKNITLTQSDGKVAKTTLYVRLVASDYATETGEATGTITIASEGVSPFKEISLSGTVVAAVTVTFNNNGSTDGAPTAIKLAKGGTLGSNLPGVGSMTAPIAGYSFVGWVNHDNVWTGFESTLTQTLITGNETINADVTYDAVWAKGSNDFELMGNSDPFTDGNYIITYSLYYGLQALGNVISGSNITTIEVDDQDEGVIANNTEAKVVWTLHKTGTNTVTFYNADKGQYLQGTSSALSFTNTPVNWTWSMTPGEAKYTFSIGTNGLYYLSNAFQYHSNPDPLYIYKQQISNFFVTTPNEYTVTWHKGNAGTATSSAFEGQTFADIAENAPSVDNDAAGDCANKFMGWATESIASNEGVEENAVAWAKDNTDPISGNIDYYAVFANASGSASVFFDDLNISGTNEVSSRTNWSILYKIYGGSGSAKLGSSSYSGYLITDALSLNGTATISFKIKQYDKATLVLSVEDGESGYVLSQTDFPAESSDSWTECSCTLTGAGTNAKLKFYSYDRLYLKDVSVSCGSYSNYITSCTPPVYTAITLDKGTNGQTDGSATAQQGKTDLTDFTHAVGPDHYHLLGYYDNETQVIDANGNLVANVTNYTDADGKWLKDDESLTLTAQWEVNSHTLTWAGLDGANITTAGSPAAGTVAWNTPLTAPIATKDGFQLIGWSPEVPATMPDDDATYTALWAPVIVITGQPTDKTCYQDDDDVSLTIIASIGEGSLSYQWQSSTNGTDGWTDIANATEATYKPSTNAIGTTYYRCVVTSNLGLEETSSVAAVTVNQKLSNKYTITYAFDAWSTDPGTQVLEVDGGSTVTLPAGMTKEGYNFVKWEMSDGTFKQPGETFTMPTENILILAVLEEIQQTVSYTINGSAAAQLTAWTAQPTQVGYWDNDLTAEYTITDGYYVSAAAVTVNDVALTAETEFLFDDKTITIMPSANKFAGVVSITLTVEPMQYTVTLSALGATNTYTSQVEATFGQDMPAIATLPIRPGYTFLGYYDAQTGGTQYYLSTGASAHTWDISAGATLYAQWSTVSYGITYTETTNLTWGEKPANVTIETNMLTANYTVTAGYEVTGMTVTVGGNAVAAGDIDYDQTKVDIMTTFSGAVVITPTVTPKNYTLTFHKNVTGDDQTYTQGFYYGQTQTLTANTFTRTGYLFQGWANTSTSETKAYDDEGSYTYSYTSNRSLYAMWAENPADWFDVTFIDQMQDTEVANPEQYQHLLTGSEITFPTLDDKTPPDSGGGEVQCNEEHYHFVGWVLSTELDQLGTTATIHEGGSKASVTANATYYAIWATATMD